MATKRRRRGGERPKRAKKALRVKDDSYKWGPQVLAAIFAALSLFVLLSVLLNRPYFSQLTAIDGPSVLGPAGRFVGVLLYGFFGWCSLLLGGWLGYLSVIAWKGKLLDFEKRHSFWIISLGAVGAYISLCAIFSVFFGRTGGGDIGALLATPLLSLFNSAGSALILAILFVMFLSFMTGLSFGELGAKGWEIATDISILLFVNIPIMAFRAFLAVFSLIASGIASILGYFFSIKIPQRFASFFSKTEGKENVPIVPRRHRNTLENTDDTPLDELKSKIKVRRRGNGAKVSLSELERKRKLVQRESESGYFKGEYVMPSIKLLPKGSPPDEGEGDEELLEKSRLIEKKLRDFNIRGRVTEIHPGPVITLFEFEPAAGIKVGRIAALSDDLAMTLKAISVRIIAPIPGKGTVGIEVPNKERELVRLRDILESPQCVKAESILTVALGKDTYGNAVVSDIAKMPHLLIAGATGTGKSVCVNAILLSLLYRATPEELGLILIDPKILELSVYEGIPHLRVPVVTVPRQAKAVLEWAVKEMNRRYRTMQHLGVRSIDSYNRVVRGEEDPEEARLPLVSQIEIERSGELDSDSDALSLSEELSPLPRIVIVIDELADLMLTVGREVEELITKLAQKARAAGIHLVVATQRPSVDVITGLIKANFPARLSFQVSSRVDSRTIIDVAGAEKLLGKGDMLFMPPGVGSLIRVHGAFVSDSEVKRVVSSIKKGCSPVYDEEIIEMCKRAIEEENRAESSDSDGDYDPLYDEAVKVVLEKGKASTSLIQRVLRIGYNRAARIIDTMEREGIIGPADGAKPREVLLSQDV